MVSCEGLPLPAVPKFAGPEVMTLLPTTAVPSGYVGPVG